MSFASRRGREMASAILPFPPADAHIRGCPARTLALAAPAAVSSMPPRAGACIRNDPRSASARRGGRSAPRPAHRPGLVRIPQPYGDRGFLSADQKFRDRNPINFDPETGAGRDLHPAGLVRDGFSQNRHPHRMLGLVELEEWSNRIEA